MKAEAMVIIAYFVFSGILALSLGIAETVQYNECVKYHAQKECK